MSNSGAGTDLPAGRQGSMPREIAKQFSAG